MILASRWTTTLRNERLAGRPWHKELLRIRLVVEWPAGSDDVFAVGHAGALANQSAIVADVVLRELCSGRREITG